MAGIKSTTNLSHFEPQEGNQFRGAFYASCGEKCKIIGLQDGTFPDFGHHSPKEMGGVWTHPIKVLDGFWLKVNGAYPLAASYETFPHQNVFTYNLSDGIALTRTQTAFDDVKGAVISYQIHTTQAQTIHLSFVCNFDLLPVWFSETCGVIDGEDSARFDEDARVILAKDNQNDWFGAVGCDFEIEKSAVDICKKAFDAHDTFGKGVSAKIDFSIEAKADSTTQFQFFIAGSFTSETDVLQEMNSMKTNFKRMTEEKAAKYRAIKAVANLKTGDGDFDTMYEWVKYSAHWLTQDCAQYGRALSAGLPEYAWWFGCDNAYSVQGLLAMGEFELARQTLVLLKNYSEKANGNGKIVHEINTMGMVSNTGNTQETPHFITAVYHYLRYTNDRETVGELYEYCKKGIDWLLNVADDDSDLLPSGYGIIEIKGLNVELIDSAVYTCQALFDMYEMSVLFHETNTSYQENAQKLKDKINTWLWNEELLLYSDAVGTPRQILERISAMEEQSRHDHCYTRAYQNYMNALKSKLLEMNPEIEVPFILNKNWVISTPMETQLAPYDKAIAALDSMNCADFVGEYGVYLDGFSNRSIMTISTGVQAVAEGRYGRSEHAYALLKRMNKSFSCTMPGAINEMSPDYGCFSQAWTIYAVAVPVLECFAGIKPMAHQNKVIIEPNIPMEMENFSLRHIKIAESILDFDLRDGQYTIVIQGEIQAEFVQNKTVRILKSGTNQIKKE